MSDNFPSVTVIIPAKPGLAEIKSADAAAKFDYPRGKLEILIARGTQPSVQRNTAVRQARGDLIYFLDDDSVAPAENLRRAAPYFAQPDVAMVGGPNLCPADAPPLEQAFAEVMASWLAFGPSRARYRSVGNLRASGEKELILCNLLARRSEMLAVGGFDESLYPNEENALMDHLVARGGKLLYDPELVVLRRPRKTLKSFCRMLVNYGRGRAEQFRVHPTPGSALNFVPPLFCLYVATVPLAFWFAPLAAPLGLYLLAVLVQTLAAQNKRPGILLRVFPLIILTHMLYGLGFWRGLFTKLKPPGAPSNVPVTLERIEPA
ncbi:MAG TPA: glycosyltransferase [Verrucomicrobiae bacterium]|jgi:glycosyltransferase involved in cell wall biosynthesis